MKPKFRSLIAASIVVTFSNPAFAAPVIKENNTDALNLNSSWVGGTTQPGPGDIAVWNATVNANQTVPLGADLSWGGINMTDSGGDITISAGNTLTLGASGITSAVNKWIWIEAPVVMGAAQTWTTPNNLHINGAISGGFALTKAGPEVLLLSNTANNTAGGILVSAGTLRANNGGNFTNGGLGSGTITLQTGGTLDAVIGTNNTWDFLNPIAVASGQVGTINTPNRFEMKGAVTGSGTLNMNIVTNTSRADFRNSFTGFTGNLNFTGTGVMRFRINQSAPAFNGASFTDTKMDLAGSVGTQVVSGSGGNTLPIGALTGSSAAAFLGGGTAGTATYSIGGLGTDTVFDGGFTGNTAVAKVGAGKLTLTNTTLLTYTGATTISDGTLKMMGIKSGSGATTVNGTGRLSGNGSLAGTTTIASNGILAPGDAGVGTLTFSNLTLASGGILNVSVGNSTATVSSGGTLTLTSGAKVDVNGFDTDGTYTLINYAGATLAGAPVATALSVINGGSKVYSFSDTGTAINVTISSNDPTNYWNVDGDGTWNTAGNWTKNQIPNSIGAFAKVGPGVGGGGGFFTDLEFTITLNANQTIGTLAVQTDRASTLTIDPGTPTAGSLLFDNGVTASVLTGILGDIIVNAPIGVDADGLTVDVGQRIFVAPDTPSVTPFLTTLNGVVSGASAAITKSGLGTLVLAGVNTYGGGTSIGAGIVNINSATSLGNASGATTFAGGTLQIANALTAITRSYKVAGSNNAIIDTNSFAFGYDGVISPLGGGTGGLTKIGGGTLTLTAAQTYTGATTVTGGTLAVAGGSITSGVTSSVASSAIALSSGSVAFNGGFNANTGNPSANCFINLTGGTFSTSFFTMGRCTSNAQLIFSPGAAGRTDAGLYINGAAATISGNLSIGSSSNSNSTSTARMDSGSLTVGGAITIQVNSPDRWSVLDVNGGTFTSTDTVTGVQVGSGLTGNDGFLVRNGTATVERILLVQPAASTLISRLNVSGGSLYVGSGGIVGNNNAGTGVLDVQLGTATLGAKADWSSLLGATLNGTTIVKAADVTDVAHDISIAGVVTGTGGLEKTGGGKLTLSGANNYAGTTLVSAGTLAVSGDSTAAVGAVTVATGARLGGTGTVGGVTNIASGGGMTFDLITPAGSHDRIDFLNNLTFDGASTITITASAAGAAPGVYTLVNCATTITGSLPSVVLPPGWTADAPVKTSTTITIKINSTATGTPYSLWAAGYLPADVSNPAGDNDKDGLTNQQEFAYGLNPTSGSSVNPILVKLNKNSGTFTYQRRANTGLTYRILTSTTLTGWAEDVAATNGQAAGIVDGNGNQTVVVTLSGAPLTATKFFVRVAAQ